MPPARSIRDRFHTIVRLGSPELLERYTPEPPSAPLSWAAICYAAKLKLTAPDGWKLDGVTLQAGPKVPGIEELRADPRFVAAVAAGELIDHGSTIELSRKAVGLPPAGKFSPGFRGPAPTRRPARR